MPLPNEFIHALHNTLTGEVRYDLPTRLLYSTDASIYQIEPLGVAFPRTVDELSAAVEIASSYKIPILARGAGSSLAGQAIGPALILDCSRYLNKILVINPDERTATVEPGVILQTFNKVLADKGFQFGPDPASAERATLGGCIGNNASGAHSLIYGMTADHLLAAEVVLSDGTVTTFRETGINDIIERRSLDLREQQTTHIEEEIYNAALSIRHNYPESIKKNWSKTWRQAAGYNLNYLIPWSPATPPLWMEYSQSWHAHQDGGPIAYPPLKPGFLNIAHLLAGSEGTLALIRKATLRIVPKPKHTILGILAYQGIPEACDAVPELLEFQPSAIELLPNNLIQLARSLPAYAQKLSFVDQVVRVSGDTSSFLIIEFQGDSTQNLKEQIQSISPKIMIAEEPEAQKQIWEVRKVGLGIFMSRPGDYKPVAFIEDLSIPVSHLGEFTREIERILAAFGTQGDCYAHASVGCLHIRPLINLKTPGGISDLRGIATEAVNLTLRLGGAVSGEHSLGLARGEWLEKAYGEEIIQAFRQLKQAADPHHILNPGKIIDVQPMDVNLRYGTTYQAKAWMPVMDFTHQGGSEGEKGLSGAIEKCNGAGVCRKPDGVMCPSFQATQDEMYSTRGRANLLRAMISGRFPKKKLAEQAVRQALDLCLACKGCKSECPSGVDIAKLKYEYTHQYYKKHPRHIRDYLFGYIRVFAWAGSPFAKFVNALLRHSSTKWVLEYLLGISRRRNLPYFAHKTLTHLTTSEIGAYETGESQRTVLFLNDTFTNYFYPESGLAAIHALEKCGYQVIVLPIMGAGRTLISKGFLEAAKQHAMHFVNTLTKLDTEEKLPIIGIEPSEIYTLVDEYPDLLPDDPRVSQLLQRVYTIEEFLIRPEQDGISRLAHLYSKSQEKPIRTIRILLHGHCYQKSRPPSSDGYPSGVAATQTLLKEAGYQVELIDSGCCGMAGAFGYEKEHYELSMKVGELYLFPAIRKASQDVMIAASGVSCQAQITDGTHRQVFHPITFVVQ